MMGNNYIVKGSNSALEQAKRKSKAQVEREQEQRRIKAAAEKALRLAEAIKRGAEEARERIAQQKVVAQAVGLVLGKPAKRKKRR